MLMKTETTEHVFPLGFATEGEWVEISEINNKNLAKRLMTMGLTDDVKIQVLYRHHGAGVVIRCGSTRLALGAGTACKIMVKAA